MRRFLAVAPTLVFCSCTLSAADKPSLDGIWWSQMSPAFKLGWVSGCAKAMDLAGTLQISTCAANLPMYQSTDVHQNLMFGFYRICRLVGDAYLCGSEGVIYSEAIMKEELNQVGTFVANTLADVEVKQFPPETRLHVHRSSPEFMQKVFWPAVRRGWLISGYNLAFDLSRLSRGWRRSRKGGFRLILSLQLDYKRRTWKPHPLPARD